MTMPRPDELASQSQVASNRAFNQSAKGLGKAAISAATGAGAAGIASKILPLLSEFIPAELALKGINKVAPQLGQMLNKGMEQGLDLQEGFNFIKDKLSKSGEPAKQNGNIIEQYSPELFKYLEHRIVMGETPQMAASAAENEKDKHNTSNKTFKNAIENMVKDHKLSWSEIVQNIFGTGQTAQPTKKMSGLQRMLSPAETPEEQGAVQAAAQKMMGGNRTNPLSSMSAQDAGDPRQMGDQELMAALQKVLSM